MFELQGVVNEFRVPKGEDPKAEKYQFQWLYVNGLLSIIFVFGLLYTALKSRKARSWLYGTGLCRKFLWQPFFFKIFYQQSSCYYAESDMFQCHTGLFRSFIADYGVPLMVVVWTALSFSVPSKVPSGVPRRLNSPLPWDSESVYHWTVIKVMVVCKFVQSVHLALTFGFHCILKTNASNTQITGYGQCPSSIHLCCHYSCFDDSRALFLRSQCCFTDGTTEGVQSQETFCLSPWHLAVRIYGMYKRTSRMDGSFPVFISWNLTFLSNKHLRLCFVDCLDYLLQMGSCHSPPCTLRALLHLKDRCVDRFRRKISFYCC